MATLRSLLLTVAVILISMLPAQAQRSAEATHIVRPGETLGLIAQRYGVNIYQLAALNGISNAHLIFSWQQLAIPSEAFPADPATSVRGTHIVQPGESLDSIAKFYGINLFELQTLNNIYHAWIFPGDELALPVEGPAPETPAADPVSVDTTPAPIETSPAPSASGLSHVVRFGETLGTIAADYGVSLLDLQQINDIWTYLIYAGQELQIPAGGTPPTTAPAPDSQSPVTQGPTLAVLPDTHIVQRGETLFSIAQQYDVTVDALMTANGIADPRRIHSGLELRVHNLETAIPPQATSPATAPAVPSANRDQYVVLPGEYLSTIGAKLGMSWLAIAAINGISDPDSLYASAVLQVPTAEEAARYGPVYPAVTDPGAHLGVGRELVVVLSTQTAYAYENGILQKRSVISSGLPATPTVQGNYKIYRKLRYRHMVGPDYDLPNVPWVMYFYQGYAFHGTYWHNNFGTPMSHGCVNMTNADAQWFYNFAPVGTPVHVRFY